MLERLHKEIANMSVKQKDRQFIEYFNIREQFDAEASERWQQSSIEDRQWIIAEELLRQELPPVLVEARLGYVGMSLADFVPEGYNYDQVARDSDGHKP